MSENMPGAANAASGDTTVFVGGSIGSEPYARNTWSGSCRQLLRAMESEHLLAQAVGVKLPRLSTLALMAKNFATDRAIWRQQFYMDPAYRNALTGTAAKVHVESGTCLQIGAMFNLAEAFPQKACFSLHDGNLPQLMASGFGLKGVPAKRIDRALAYEQRCAQAMTGVLTFSEYLRQSFIRDYGVAPERVHNVGGAVNFDELPAAPQGKDYATGKLLFIGVDFVRKGGPLLLEAFCRVRQSMPELELHIVGPADPGLLPPNVIAHGRMSWTVPEQKATLEALFAQAALFVMPSLYEPYGIAPLEAMLYAIPCLVTDDWALREHVIPGVNGDLVRKGSVDDLTAKLAALLAAPENLETMGRTAREFAVARFTWPAVAKRMRAVFEAAL